MSKQKAARLAWGLVALTVALLGGSVILDVVGGAGWELDRRVHLGDRARVLGGRRPDRDPRGPGTRSAGSSLGRRDGGIRGAWPTHTPITGSPARAASEAVGEAAASYANLSWIPFILVPPRSSCCCFPTAGCSRDAGAGRLVRGARHRRRVRDERFDAGRARGLSAAREPLRRRQPPARSAHRARLPRPADRHRGLVGLAHRPVPPGHGRAAPADQVACVGGRDRGVDAPGRPVRLRLLGRRDLERRDHAQRPRPSGSPRASRSCATASTTSTSSSTARWSTAR